MSESGCTLQAFQDSTHHSDCGLLWTTTTWQSLPSTSFPILFLIRRMVEIGQSNLSTIYWAVRPASVNPTTIFRCCPDYIVCVYDISNTTMRLNNEEVLVYSLITVWYVAVPVSATRVVPPLRWFSFCPVPDSLLSRECWLPQLLLITFSCRQITIPNQSGNHANQYPTLNYWRYCSILRS